MYRKSIKKTISVLLSVGLIMGSLSVGGLTSFAEESGADGIEALTSLKTVDLSSDRLRTNYTKVSSAYTSADYSGETIICNIEDIISEKEYLTDENYDYEAADKVAMVETGDVFHVKINVPETAVYRLGIDYLSYDTSILPVEIGVKIDGEYPFY